MMKIGILTFCNANNYGAALQAYSLLKKVQEYSPDAELIDYRSPAIEAMHQKKSVFQCSSIKRIPYLFQYNKSIDIRQKVFDHFRTLMNRSRVYTPENIKEANSGYDLFISGSDQVFNLSLTKGDTAYYLDFAGEDKKKVSYAPSLGAYLPEEKETYQRLLKRFDVLSLREKESAAILKKEIGIDCQVIPDPVFLHTKDEWQKMLNLRQEKSEPYILIYSLYETKELYQLAEKVKKKLGYKTVLVTKSIHPLGKADQVYQNPDPQKFLELLFNANYVVTNSFHGTAFSLIFEKQFSVMKPSKAPERILDLWQEAGLVNKRFEAFDSFEISDICYPDIRSNLLALRENGENYLKQLFDTSFK